jgi:hypothetical protein
MKNLTRHLWLAVTLLVIVNPAWAGAIGMNVDNCPTDASAGSTISIDLTLTNKQCVPVTVRLMSSISGNANQTVGGIGIWGPMVADTIVVPAAESIHEPASCVPEGECTGDFTFCTSDLECESGVCRVYAHSCGNGGMSCSNDADCSCGEDPESEDVTPEIAHFPAVQMPPAIPDSLDGTVATFILAAEANNGYSTKISAVKHCLVNVAP